MKPRKTSSYFRLAAAATTFIAITLSARAANTWVGTTNVWDTATTANWTSPTTWTTGDDAVFDVAGVGAVNIATGGVTAHNLAFNTTGYTIQGAALTLNGTTPTVTTATGVSTTLASVVAGTAGLAKSGDGTLILTGANTYSNGTTINAGTLQVGVGGTTGTLGTGNIVDNATLAYNLGNTSGISLPTGTAISGSGNLTATARDIKFNGNITLGGSQSYTQIGGQSLYTGVEVLANTVLTGSSITLSGDVGQHNVTAKTLTLDTSAANGTINMNISTGRNNVWYNIASVTLNAGTGTINITGTGPSNSGWNAPVTLNGALNITGSIANVQSSVFHATANSTISGSIGVNNGLNGYTPFNVDSGATLTVSGVLSGVSGVSWGGFLKQGAGTMILQSANTGMGQGARITGGSISFVHGGLNAPNTANSGRGYTLDFQGSATLQWAAGNTDDVSAGNNLKIGDGFTATFDTGANNVTLGTAMVLGTLKTGAVTKIGSGTLTLSGANSYGGATTVAEGKLALSSSQSGTGAIMVNDGAALAVTVAGSSQLSPATLTEGTAGATTNEFSGLLSASVAPVKAGTLTANATTTINILSGTFIAGQIYPLIAYTTLNGTGTFVLGTLPTGVTANLITYNNSIALNVTAAPSYVWTGAVNGNWDINTTANWIANGVAATYADNTLAALFDDTASNFSVNAAATVTPLGVIVNNTANPYTIGGSAIAGTGKLFKLGTNTLTLTGTNTYSGGTTLSGGTIAFSTSSLGSGPVNFAGDATLLWNAGNTQDKSTGMTIGSGSTATIDIGTNNVIFAGAIGGTNGNLAKAGTGTLALTGANAYTGTTTINAGTINVGNGGASGSLGTGAIVDNSALIFNLNGTTASLPAAGVTGTGTLAVTADTIVLNGNVTTGGNQSYSSTAANGVNNHGIRVLGSPGTTLTATNGSSITMSGPVGYTNTGVGGALNLDTSSGNGTINLNIGIGPNNSLYPVSSVTANAGTGIINVTGTYSGGNWGGCPVTLTGAMNITGNILFNNGALTLNSTAVGTVTGNLSGSMSLVKQGAATLTLSGANTYTGNTTINAGTLALQGSGSIATSPIVDVQASGTLDGGPSATVQALRGSGTLLGTITVAATGSLSPAGSGTIGTLTENGTLNLTGNAVMDIAKSGSTLTCDTVAGSGAVNYGGTLTVTATGDTLALGDTFTLFSNTGGLGGHFTTLNLPALGAGLSWNTTQLAINGTIIVSDNAAPPSFSPSSGNYVGAQAVSISSDVGSTIYYTMDGTDPLTSPTTISASSPALTTVPTDSTQFTLTAYATKPGKGNSSVSIAVYNTITTPTWNFNGGGNWSDSTKWLKAVIPDGSGVTADFSVTPQTANSTVTLDTNRTIGSMTFANTNGFSWSVAASNSSVLTLATGTGTPAINVLDHTANMAAALAGTQGLTKQGGGTLVLNSGNTFTGGLTVQQGMVDARGTWSSNTALGIGAITIGSGATVTKTDSDFQEIRGDVTLSGGTLAATGTPNNSYGNFFLDYRVIHTGDVQSVISAEVHMRGTHEFNVADGAADIDLLVTGHLGNEEGYNWGYVNKTGAGTMALSNSTNSIAALTITAGKVILQGIAGSYPNGGIIDNSALEINIASGSGTFSPVISGSGTLTKTGNGTLILGGTNTFSGVTTVNAGTLAVRGTSIRDTNQLVINGGMVDATGTETVGTLFFGSVQKAAGTWGATGSGATHIDDTHFSGTGVVNVVSGPSNTFDGWMNGFTFAPGADKTPAGDPDHDGISNGMEYALGLNPTQPNGAVGSLIGGVISFTKGAEAIANGDVTYIIESSDDLGVTDPWVPAVTQSPPDASPTIEYTLPTGKQKTFARLRVIIND